MGIALLAVTLALQGKPPVITTFPWRLGAFEYTPAGVCSMTAETLECWDMQGDPSPSIAERIKAFYLVSSNDRHAIPVRFGRLNRALVVERRGPTDQGPGTEVQGEDGTRLSTLWVAGRGPGLTLEWAFVAAEPSATTASLTFGITELAEKQPGPLPVVPDTTSVMPGGGTIRWIKPKAVPETASAGERGQKTWIIGTISSMSSLTSWPPTAFDREGAQIRFVDANGRPSTSTSSLREARFRWFNNDLLTTVDPRVLASVSFRLYESRRGRIEGFPLQPKTR